MKITMSTSWPLLSSGRSEANDEVVTVGIAQGQF